MRFLTIPALLASLLSLPAIAAVEHAALEAGSGTRVQMVRASVQVPWGRPMWQSNGTHIAAHWDFSIAQWRGTAYRNVPGDNQHITDIGVTPTFRFQRDSARGWYGEGAIGYHLLSALYDNDGSRLSTAFQFGDHLGVGYVFNNGWDASLKVQHFSNGGIKRPNSGANFLVLRVARPF
ncbi:acyloxyacyl hydrolase [Massilia sp. PAMC28688]|uniref:acyloxyacyl hydrolase n=1 Tax=Massilia sp. PAMC28688 TaxID=2861283 RepID=UPI001C63B60C|nr:acyloxyacyl hydrolase [Massilia sp. PAMC28688]QYF95468.1 acyloxyacyl hydrolase [Massilia sp. PAMC28688]